VPRCLKSGGGISDDQRAREEDREPRTVAETICRPLRVTVITRLELTQPILLPRRGLFTRPRQPATEDQDRTSAIMFPNGVEVKGKRRPYITHDCAESCHVGYATPEIDYRYGPRLNSASVSHAHRSSIARQASHPECRSRLTPSRQARGRIAPRRPLGTPAQAASGLACPLS
jgi:hypothetical protein